MKKRILIYDKNKPGRRHLPSGEAFYSSSGFCPSCAFHAHSVSCISLKTAVFDDKDAARETLDRVREFVRNNPTVYCGTHTPQGYENLEAKRVIDLDNPMPTVFAEVDFSGKQATGKYVCSICGYIYDPDENDGTAFEDLPDDWKCPRCKQGKDKFNPA